MTATQASAADRRQELRELLIRRRRAELAGDGRIVPIGRDGALPLSWQQSGLWFLHQLDPGSATYHLSLVLRLRGELDRAGLAAALVALVTRHEGLRTRFVLRDGQPAQLIDPPPAVLELPVVELPGSAWQELVMAEVRRPFRLSSEPGFRWWLGRLAADDHVLVLNSHHIITDGWSVGILTADLSSAYQRALAGGPSEPDALLGLPPLPIQPADYAAWQHQHPDQLDAGLAYWTRQLADLPTVRLPTDRPRPALPTGAGGGLRARIEPAIATGITALAGRLQVSPLAVVLGGFSTVLHRYTGQPDLPIGSVFSGRTRTELEPLIGYLANTVVLRTRIDDNATGESHIKHCQDTILQAMQHQDTPFSLLVDTLQPARIPGRNPLFQIALTLLPAALGGRLRLGELTVEGVPVQAGSSRFDLSVQVAPQADGSMALSAEYASELFDADRIERLLAHLTRTLAELVTDSSQSLDRVLLLTEAERNLISGPADSSVVPTISAGRAAAGSATLQAVLDILTELLEPAGTLQPEDNFFVEGGNSLKLTRLATAIQDRYGIRVETRELYLAPTLAEIAALVDERVADRSAPEIARTALLPLRLGGTRPPLFLVHAIGGSAASYLPLVDLLDPTQPIYAFEASSVRPGSTVASIAAEYLTELRAVQPHGPYRLAGWSVGGVVAQQLAVQLRAAGEEVGLLALLDSMPSPPNIPVPDHARMLNWFLHDLLSIRGLPGLDPQLLQSLPESEQLPCALTQLVTQRVIEEADQEFVATRFEVFTELARAFLRHRPTPLDCPIELLVAADGAVDPVPRWQAVGGPLITHHLPGDHYTMLQSPHLDLVAAVLNQLLLRSHDQAAHRAAEMRIREPATHR